MLEEALPLVHCLGFPEGCSMTHFSLLAVWHFVNMNQQMQKEVSAVLLHQVHAVKFLYHGWPIKYSILGLVNADCM